MSNTVRNLVAILGSGCLLLFVPTMKAQDAADASPSGASAAVQGPNPVSAACDQLQRRLDAYKAAHESCLASQSHAKPGPESSEICSYSACQPYHSYVYGSAGQALSAQIDSCRAAAVKYQNRQAAEGDATRAITDAFAALTASNTTAPLDSQADLSAYDQQKSADSVIGDNSDAQLSMSDDVAKLAQNNGTQPTNTDDKTLDSLTADAAKSDDKTNVAKAAEAAGDVMKDYLQKAASMWGNTKEFTELAEPFAKLSDAMDAASIASTGQVPSTIPGLNQISAYVDKQKSALDSLSQKSATDWLVASGLNSFNPTGTGPQAQEYLDGWSQRLNGMQQLITNSLPSLQTAQKVLDTTPISGFRMAVNSSMAGLDPTALQDLITQLNLCSSKITSIQEQLKLARSVAH